ncbi:hypothetical protein [Candidatus Poriferisocius sp.]|uniref:hypothetical protein n=1 Tax=Candidatus Poriferisocius sp. TaxID=3101276 RepID=UPI003B524998
MAGKLLASVVVVVIAAGLAATAGAPVAGGQTNPFGGASGCAILFGFAAEPVPVVKSADGQTVLASVRWGYSVDNDICLLILDDPARQSLVNTYRLESSSFTAVAAGGFHSCGIRINNTVECWGANWYGQVNVPAGRFAAVSAGYRHSCGVRADGAVECWDWTADLPVGVALAS